MSSPTAETPTAEKGNAQADRTKQQNDKSDETPSLHPPNPPSPPMKPYPDQSVRPSFAGSPNAAYQQRYQRQESFLPMTNAPNGPEPLTPHEIAALQCAMEFSEKSVRRAFIKKVYGILTAQLLVTLGVMALCIFLEPIKICIYHNVWMVWTALGVYFVLLIALVCCPTCRYHSPMNYICLAIFTLATGLLIGFICTFYKVDSVILAVGITAVMCLGLTLFAFQTKWDFTLLTGFIFVICLWFLLFGLLMLLFAYAFPHTYKLLHVLYNAIGVLVFSLFFVYDTQLMMGGNHAFAYHPEDYVFAALSLYLDVINMFLHLLSLFGNRN